MQILSEYEMFSLETFLETFPVDKSIILNQNRPNYLLSQVSTIPSSLVEQLERIGIFDTDDFLLAGVQIMDYISINSIKYGEILQAIVRKQKANLKLPKQILKLPENYAIVSISRNQSSLSLSLYWRGLRLKIKQFGSWDEVKLNLDNYLRKMDWPELIGRITLDKLPSWLDDVTPLATYISNLQLTRSLTQHAISWGLDKKVKELFEPVDQELLAQLYLLSLDQKLQS